MFRIEMLPAQQGDCLFIEYGTDEDVHRVLIDGGTPPTFEHALKARIESLAPEDRHFELFVITHIDTDHIGGVLKLLDDRSLGLQFDDVWFNAWRHIDEAALSRLGPIDGEILSVQLDASGWPWNQAFEEGPAVVPGEGSLPVHELAGGMTLTLLSPGVDQLVRLRTEWEKVVREAGLEPGTPAALLEDLAAKKGVELEDLLGATIPVESLADGRFDPDRAVANGSSIAFVAEYEGKSCLFTGDGFPPVIQPSVERLLAARERESLPLDALKLPHHGSKHNISNDLLGLVRCGRYLFSSNGNIFNHPDQEAVARVIVNGGADSVLTFNYRTEFNEMWDDKSLMDEFRYSVEYPEDGQEGLTVEL